MAEIVSVEFEEKTDHHWTNNWGSVKSVSESIKESYVKTSEKGRVIRVDFREENGFTPGKYYHVGDYSYPRSYGVLIYNVDTKKYSYLLQNLLSTPNRVTMIEEADNIDDFDSQIGKSLEFDLDEAVRIAENNIPAAIHKTDAESSSSSSAEYACRRADPRDMACEWKES